MIEIEPKTRLAFVFDIVGHEVDNEIMRIDTLGNDSPSRAKLNQSGQFATYDAEPHTDFLSIIKG